jgi:hypothetical protein
MNRYVVRTPFGNDGEGFHKAMKRIKAEALERFSIEARWKRGRDKRTGRYHFWVIDDRDEAMMFLLAFGDQITEKQVEVTNERAESIKENMVKKQGERNDYNDINHRR